MKLIIAFSTLTIAVLTACKPNTDKNTKITSMPITADRSTFKSGYSAVNGLKMQYEIYGQVSRLFSFMEVDQRFKQRLKRLLP
ncbi:hypothetical protein GCM10027299_40640 [Larkinella ripae]